MADKNVILDLQARIDEISSKGSLAEMSEAEGHCKVGHPCNASFGYDPNDSGYENGDNLENGSDGNNPEKALKKIIALVNVSERSELKLRERLSKDGFEDEAIEIAIERALDYGFVDDMRFADILIRSRISQMKGSVGIERELVENGIDVDTVPGWPFEYSVSHEEEIERAISLLDRKPPRAKNARDAAYRRLMQKGYPSSVASSAARIWSQGDR